MMTLRQALAEIGQCRRGPYRAGRRLQFRGANGAPRRLEQRYYRPHHPWRWARLSGETPLEMAGAYTVFANGGLFCIDETVGRSPASRERSWYGILPVAAFRDRIGHWTRAFAWLMVSMLQEVLRSGTGAGVRSRGFTTPCGRQDRDFSRWLVRRIHFPTSMHCLGRL